MENTNKNLDQMPKKSPFSFQVDLSKFEKATDEEKRQQEVMSESSTFFKPVGSRKYYCIAFNYPYYCNYTIRCTV